jgi:hypothetical protein
VRSFAFISQLETLFRYELMYDTGEDSARTMRDRLQALKAFAADKSMPFLSLQQLGLGRLVALGQAALQPQVILVHWFHKIPILRPEDHAASNSIDPLASTYGMERVVWSRRVRGEPEKAPNLDGLYASILRRQVGKRKRDATTAEVRKSLDAQGKRIYRHDDAFAGNAHCDIQSVNTVMFPAEVLPVFASQRNPTSDPCDVSQVPWLKSGPLSAKRKTIAESQSWLSNHYDMFWINLLSHLQSTVE